MSGTLADPISFDLLITSDRVQPGANIYLMPGTYNATRAGVTGSNAVGKGVYDIKLNGTVENPIIIQPYTPGTVRINGGLQFLNGQASYITVKGLEIAPTPTDRHVPRASVDWPSCVYSTAPGINIFWCYLHDGSQGMQLFNTGGYTVEGCCVSNIGYKDPLEEDIGHGAAVYTHNHPGGACNLHRNAWHTFGEHAINLWSASSNDVKDYDFIENAIIRSSIFCGGYSGQVKDNTIDRNHAFGGYIRLGGYDNPNNGLVYVRNNRAYFSTVPIWYWWQRAAVVTGNVFANDVQVIGTWSANSEADASTIDNNAYFAGDGLATSHQVYSVTDARSLTWAEWNAKGFDAASTITDGLPTANSVNVYPYTAMTGALVVIWNWEGLESVTVDLSSAFEPETNITVISALNYNVDRADTATGLDGTISIDMRAASHSVAAPLGTGLDTIDTTFPAFGAFMVVTR